MKKRILWLAVDLTVAVLIVLAVWIVSYKIPQKGIKAATFLQIFSYMELYPGVPSENCVRIL